MFQVWGVFSVDVASVGCSKCRVWMAGMIGLAGLADKGTWRELG